MGGGKPADEPANSSLEDVNAQHMDSSNPSHPRDSGTQADKTLIKNQLSLLQSRGIMVQLSPQAEQQQVLNFIDNINKNLQQQPNPSNLQQLSLSSNQNDNGTAISKAKRRVSNSNNLESIAKKAKDFERSDNINTKLSNNRFALLSDLISCSGSNSETIANTIDNTNIPNATSAKNNSNSFATVNPPTPKRFCPPIVLFDVNICTLVRQFREKFPDIDIKIVNKSANKSKLFIRDFDAYREMMDFLKQSKIKSHSYTPEQSKQVSLILRGLHHFMEPLEIKSELDQLLPNTIDTVKEFTTPHMKKSGIKPNLFLVTLNTGMTAADISKIKYISYQRVTWEKPKSFSREVQCKNCQRWGHLAKNCNHAYKCVKCDKAHEPGQCALIKEDGAQPFCINCMKWGHPANYRGCEIFKKYLSLKNLTNTKIVKAKANQIVDQPFVKPGISYANVLRSNEKSGLGNLGPKPKSKLISDFLSVAKEVLSYQQTSLDERIENFLSNFKIMSVDEKRAECIEILKQLNAY